MRAEIDCSAHRLRFRLVVQPKAELPVDLGLVVGVGVAQLGDDVAERLEQAPDSCPAHSSGAVARAGVDVGVGAGAFGLGLRDPGGDDRWVGAGPCSQAPL
ncbi:hypothetical protein [Micromonospora sp. NPDC005113]